MGAVLSLQLALEKRVRRSIRSASMYMSSRKSARSEAEITTYDNNVGIVLEDAVAPGKNAAAASHSELPDDCYGTPFEVLTSKFVLVQVVFNAISSVVMSVLMFYLLFVVIPVPPHEPLLMYPWYSSNLLGVVMGSVCVVSPTLVMILAPAGMPEAVDKKWFRVVRYSDCPPWMLRALVFLGPHKRWRRGLLRHVALGLTLSLVFIPVPILLARYVVVDKAGQMTSWTLIWFDTAYETILSLPCTALGLLSFSMEPNYARIREVMSTPGAMQPNPVKRLVHRVFVGCLRLLW